MHEDSKTLKSDELETKRKKHYEDIVLAVNRGLDLIEVAPMQQAPDSVIVSISISVASGTSGSNPLSSAESHLRT